MSDDLQAYLRDHLAGATFAVELLEDLEKQDHEPRASRLARTLLVEIQADKAELERISAHTSRSGGRLKDIVAWISQKASRFKLDATTPFGVFEAVEFLALGVRGKLALWDALERSALAHCCDLPRLRERASQQHAMLEGLRLDLARDLFGAAP
jgi:hypothetical protein